MADGGPNDNLSQIHTSWPTVREAHGGEGESSAAKRQLFEQYGPAIRRYLLAAVRDAHAADDLFQEFMLRFVRGDLRAANPDRGRFRDLLKAVVFRLVVDYQRAHGRLPLPLGDGTDGIPDQQRGSEAAERKFLAAWRRQLIDRTWQALERWEPVLHGVLRLRTEQAGLDAQALAEALSARLNKNCSADWVRKQVHNSRQRFADLFLDEVARSLSNPSHEALEQELQELGGLHRCRRALQRRREHIWDEMGR